jgi:alpha-tubulin suppressor-like RCC1 family protein
VQLSELTGVKDVASGDDHTCVVKADSTVACWGYDNEGQLGQGLHFIVGPVGVRMTCP